MGMFKNYHNIADNYVPNNLINSFITQKSDTKLDPVSASAPFEEYNKKGELVGYSWRQGETLNLEFNIDGEIAIESDAIVSTTSGDAPSESTMGRVGQSFYNIVDFKLWKCIAISTLTDEYIWRQYQFDYPDGEARKVYVSARDYLKDKEIDVTLYNFRHEPIVTQHFEGTPKVIFKIDKELSASLVRGIYYCSVTVSNPTVSYTIFDSNDGCLLVK